MIGLFTIGSRVLKRIIAIYLEYGGHIKSIINQQKKSLPKNLDYFWHPKNILTNLPDLLID